MAKIEDLQERLQDLNDQAHSIKAAADAERRDLNADERRDLDSILAEFQTVKEDLEREEVLAQQTATLTQSKGRKTLPGPTANGKPDDDPDDDPDEPAPAALARVVGRRQAGQRPPPEPRDHKWGWKSLGEYAVAVRKASVDGGFIDPRLDRQLAAPTTYGSEGVGGDGGFAVPPDFRNEIMQKVLGEDSLLGRVDRLTSSSNSFTFPKDETTPWQTSGGVLAYWENEGGLKSQSKPSLEQSTVRLNKIIALVPVTDELLEDAPAMDAYLRRKAPEKINFKVSLAIYQGTGVGQPAGMLNHPSTVSVAKESSQVADTIVGANILNMWSRMYGPSRSRAVWHVNQTAEPYLMRLSMPGLDNTGTAVTGWGTQLYVPPGGLSASPYGTLLGRPVIPTQVTEQLGDKGDIAFVDWSQYLAVTKGRDVKTDVSIHLWFDYDITAYRFVLRVGGMPWWGSTISPRDGSTSMSWAVTLDERA